MKSPIQPPHKPFRSTEALKGLIAPKSVIHSFLFFSGTAEFTLLGDHFLVAHTNKYVIYEFWHFALKEGPIIAVLAEQILPLDRELFYELQEEWVKQKGPQTRSAFFFLLNRYSSNGRITSGNFVKENFSPLAINRLKNLNSNHLYLQFDKEEDFLETARHVEETDYLLFPVGYYTNNFFEHGKSSGYDETKVYHKKLYEFFKNCDKKCILMYFAHPALFKMYEDHNIIMINEWGKITDKKEKCKEMLIANF